MFQNNITSSDGKFFNGKTEFRYIGCNMYELANVDSVTSEKMLRSARQQGFDVIRFWAFGNVNCDKLSALCDIAAGLDLRLIPVLSDSWGYLQNEKINDSWYTNGFRNSYLPNITEITSHLSDRKEILIWELMNEPAVSDIQNLIYFVKTVTAEIRKLNPNHLISMGTIGGVGDKFGNEFSRFNSSLFEKLYSLPELNAVSIHDYSFNSTIAERFDIYQRFKGKEASSNLLGSLDKILNTIPSAFDKFTLKYFKETYDLPLTLRSVWQSYIIKNLRDVKKLNKPVYIGEIGFKKNMGEYRKIIIEREFKKYFKSGVSGVLLWSFEAEGRSKDGHDYGFDESDDFKETINEIKNYINQL
ncbi:MAG: cellulase family glycosylhydrolase [Ignavibacteria bacterium]|nr:cellulase family glycosylhydrolase [Ignavibacteria bacterium]